MQILILEDEPVHSRYLTGLLREIPELAEAGIRSQKTVTAAECHIQDNPVDLLFLDLNVYGEDGFDLLRLSSGADFATIVVSAHPDRAIEAFEYGVLDFIPKPVTRERLLVALDRYKKNRHDSRHNLRYFSIFQDGILETIPLANICHFEASGKKLVLHLSDGTTRSCNRKIRDVEKTLPPRFQRTHRSYIVDVALIKHLFASPGGKYDLVLANGRTLPVSRRVYSDLKARLIEGR